MKQQVHIKFVEAPPRSAVPSAESLEWARNIADVLIARNEQLTSDFVFRFTSLTGLRDPDYVVREVYKAAVSGERALDPGEELICASLQKILENEERNLDSVKEVIGYVVEYFRATQKRHKYRGGYVVHRANLMINGTKFEKRGKKEIDIGVDLLETNNTLEMCECTTFVGRFIRSKSDQILFYANAFSEIRRLLKSGTKLTMELVAGYTTMREKFGDIPLPEELKKSDVQVIGVSLSTGQIFLLHSPSSPLSKN